MRDEERFLHVTNTILEDCFGKEERDGEVAHDVIAAMQKHFDQPPTSAMQTVLSRNLADAQVRQILFWPTDEEISLYPSLLAVSNENAQKDKSVTKTLTSAMPMLYLRHCREWKLARIFIMSGGYSALSKLLIDKNLYLRSQAMETLSLLTDQNDNIDWLNTKNIDSEIHKRLFQMNKGEMIPNLLANMRNSYPGGSYTALRILAFFLSWVRALYTKDKVLHVSKKVLEAFDQWKKLEDISEEERKLATTLLEDFGRWPTAEDQIASDSAKKLEKNALMYGAKWQDRNNNSAGNDSPLSKKPVEETRSQSMHAPCDSQASKSNQHRRRNEDDVKAAIEYRTEGNALLKDGDLEGAVAKYTLAIDLNPDDPVLYSNRALARLMLSPQGGSKVLEQACDDCSKALELDEKLPKEDPAVIKLSEEIKALLRQKQQISK
ncbi:hypothetical protein GUITHDRAFT_110382 [Guillardia theta CCMP2712]|uniref:Uncharacterized protein n=1 Tax=Guillardia theta (strain CCMP2712) TaxID=905079 RepID=L1J5F5_GUITC|nr:hypothetical protein GUITHDRAFT_110382 [Guillardia theta CCMP2712]EKX43577.1 hypothetical protein GUITHDRAFT_110382 [Guillardia theta CCMP2712]|eukprot:XP_005830557.1 hypothetical protein GUITHDRAFT_110382 [Guillardia theta CCMP2712]